MTDPNAAAELPIEGGQARGRPSGATPLAAAQAEQQAARAEAEDLQRQIKNTVRDLQNVDQAEHERLKAALEVALKRLRHADLKVEERMKAEYAPLSPKTVGKIRLQRRTVYDLHPTVLPRMDESRRLAMGVRRALLPMAASWRREAPPGQRRRCPGGAPLV